MKIGKVAHIFGWTANALVSLLTVGAAFGGVVDPVRSTLPALLAMTFPAWMAVVPIVLVVDLFLSRRMAIVPAITMLVCAGPALSFCPLHFGTSKPEPADAPTFKLLTYNIHGGYFGYISPSDASYASAAHLLDWPTDHNPMVSYILGSGADVVCLQECERPLWNASEAIHITTEQADSVATVYPYRLHGPDVSIISRYPLTPVDISVLPGKYEDFRAAYVEIGGERILIVTLHMASIGLIADDKELYLELTDGEETRSNIRRVRRQLVSKLGAAFRHRARQARSITAVLDSIGASNMIVCGDFNDVPDCYALRRLKCADGGLRDAYADAAFGPTITYFLNRFYFRIDHILYRGRLRPLDVERPSVKLSDHYPLEAKFQIMENG